MKNIAFLIAILVSSLSFAQNTSREPMSGGATNPVTPREAPDLNTDPKTGQATIKKKSKTKVTPTPPEPTPKQQTDTVP